MAVAPPPSCFGDSLFSHWQLGSAFPSLSTSLLPLNDSCPVALGGSGGSSSVAMAANQSLFFNSGSSGGDNVTAIGSGGSWNFEPFVSDNYYTLGTNLQTVVESMYPPAVDDYLALGSELDSLCHEPVSTMPSTGCSTSVMHPNLVSTLKSMVTSPDAGSSSNLASGSFPLFQTEPDPMATSTMNTHIAFSQWFKDSHTERSLRIGDAIHSMLTSENSCITGEQHQHSLEPMIKQEMEKSDSSADDNMEAAVVSVDLIQNRRPFRCGHDGCNKTFKNPQTMKMHHKTHYADGRAANRAGLASSQSVTPSLKAGQNKKIPSRCPKCKKTFVGLYELRRHYGRKHSEGEKGFGCRKCGKKFYIEVDVRDHEKLCGESIECKCGLKFAFKCNLVAHKKAHPACHDNHGAAATSSDDSSDQSRGNSATAPGLKPAGSSRSVGSKGSSRSHHKQKQQQQEVASPHTQPLIIPSLPDFSEDFRHSAQYNLYGMDFPLTSAAESIWPSTQYITELNSTPAATQFHSYSNFGGGNSAPTNPFFSSRNVSFSELFPQAQQLLQQDSDIFSIKAGSNLLEDLVGSSYGTQLTTAPQLPATAAANSMDRISATAYSTCSVSNFQALKNTPYCSSYMQ